MSGLDLIPDAETALKIGRVILDRYYGEDFVRRFEPYRATLDSQEEWSILGSHEDKSFKGFGGGMPAIRIAKKDAKVIHISLCK